MTNDDPSPTTPTEATLRDAVLFHALFEETQQRRMTLKNGEVVALRNDERVAEYCRSVLGPKWRGPYPPHWCGIFALWCLQAAGLAPGVIWQINDLWDGTGRTPSRNGFGFCEPLGLPRVAVPKAGDVVVFAKLTHHAIVSSFDAAGPKLETIDGNQPHITRRVRIGASPRVYYSIAPLLSAALGRKVEP